ncbi:MAG: DsbC family protein, partial [Acidovorax sp.]|nr:DsbC family protein [Acidovorax sp.]
FRMQNIFPARMAAWMGAAIIAATAPAALNAGPIELPDIKALQIDGIVKIPVKSMQAVESKGQILFVSENGRYVFSGQMYDLWSKDKALSTLGQIKASAELLNLKAMGADVDSLNTMVIGSGTREVVAFVDPKCAICHKLMADSKKLGKDYVFKFISVPALGDESNALSRRLFCAADKGARLDAFMNNGLKTLAQQPKCDTTGYDRTLLLATLIPVDGVPFVVSPDGRISRGYPANFAKWLAGEK